MVDQAVYEALVSRLRNLESVLQGSVGLEDNDGSTSLDKPIVQQLDSLVQNFRQFLTLNPEFEKFYSVIKSIGIYKDLPVKISEQDQITETAIKDEDNEKKLMVELELDELETMVNNIDAILELLQQVSVVEKRETRLVFLKISNLVHDEKAVEALLSNFQKLRKRYNSLLVRSISLFESRLLLLQQRNNFLTDVEAKLREREHQAETSA